MDYGPDLLGHVVGGAAGGGRGGGERGAVQGQQDAGGQPLEHRDPALLSLALLSAWVPLLGRGRGVGHL